MSNQDQYDELRKQAAAKRKQAAAKREQAAYAEEQAAQAARAVAQSQEQTRKILEELEKYIKKYNEGLTVCPQILVLMRQYAWLRNCYPEYWNECRSTRS